MRAVSPTLAAEAAEAARRLVEMQVVAVGLVVVGREHGAEHPAGPVAHPVEEAGLGAARHPSRRAHRPAARRRARRRQCRSRCRWRARSSGRLRLPRCGGRNRRRAARSALRGSRAILPLPIVPCAGTRTRRRRRRRKWWAAGRAPRERPTGWFGLLGGKPPPPPGRAPRTPLRFVRVPRGSQRCRLAVRRAWSALPSPVGGASRAGPKDRAGDGRAARRGPPAARQQRSAARRPAGRSGGLA